MFSEVQMRSNHLWAWIIPPVPIQRSRLHISLWLSDDVLVNVCLAVVGGGEGAEPCHGERVSEHHLQVHPLGLLGPAPLLLLQLLDARLVGADGVDLRSEHDRREDEEEEALEAQEDEEDDSRRRGEVTALGPVCFKAENEMEGHHD